MSTKPTEQQQAFIEEAGLFFEQAGWTRMAGRLLGWLLICDPPHQSSKELAAALQASKGSISATTRMLEQVRLIERLSIPGERRDYFRLRDDAWDQVMEGQMHELAKLQAVAQRAAEQIADADDERRARVDDLLFMTDFLLREFPALLERWRAVRQERRTPD
ncbi:MAG: MarR family transcriptional regulator [Chloroflexi bacterium]|nr:MarR family transcriptional regulator [Chloroflexota bacterium]